MDTLLENCDRGASKDVTFVISKKVLLKQWHLIDYLRIMGLFHSAGMRLSAG
jgi:hypothetical protein